MGRRLLLVLSLVVALGLGTAANAFATTYYVSPSGSDGAAGTSPAAAWQSVGKVNATALTPGDAVLFQGGQTFSGLLQPGASGAAGAPISFGSYGTGQANLRSGISLASRSWLAFRGLRVDTGDWRSAGSTPRRDLVVRGRGRPERDDRATACSRT